MLRSRALNCMRFALLCLLASAALPLLSQEPLPVFALTPEESKITFYVKASVALEGAFDKWDAAMTFTSPDVNDWRFGHQDSGWKRAYRKWPMTQCLLA